MFTEQDHKELLEFGKFISDKAMFTLSTQEAVKLYKYMIFLNELGKKINNNIFELKHVQEPAVDKKSKNNKS